jgi:hypothetical protein
MASYIMNTYIQPGSGVSQPKTPGSADPNSNPKSFPRRKYDKFLEVPPTVQISYYVLHLQNKLL